MTHICVGNLIIIGPDNGLSPGRRQAIIWSNAGMLLIGPWGTNFSAILIGIQTSSFKKMHLKISSAKWRPFCLGLIELNQRLMDFYCTIAQISSWLLCFLFVVCSWPYPVSVIMTILERWFLSRIMLSMSHLFLHGNCCSFWLGVQNPEIGVKHI